MNTESSSIRTTDVGSFPLDADIEKYLKGAHHLETGDGSIDTEEAQYFITKHNEEFKRKASALGPENAVPCYAQCRGMIDQFLLPELRYAKGITDIRTRNDINEISKEDGQLLAAAIAVSKFPVTREKATFAEVSAMQHGAKQICKELQVDNVSFKACVTGPLELSLNLQRLAGFPRTYDEMLIEFFTKVVKGYVESAVVSSKHLTSEIITLDEPTLGIEGLGDFFTDSKSDQNMDHLISCWNKIYQAVPQGIYKGIHMHRSPFETLFQADWNLIEAHVDVYVSRHWLENYDKFVRAAIVRTDGPTIDAHADATASWKEIFARNYEQYLQPEVEMKKNLQQSIDLYGVERIPFAGPECGLGSWDWKHGKEMALATLERLKAVLSEFNQ